MRRPARRRYDPPPRDLLEALQRLWILGILAMGAVIAAVTLTGPGDLSILARVFIWASTAAFGVFLLREHRRRLPRQQRLAIFATWVVALAVLLVVLVGSAI